MTKIVYNACFGGFNLSHKAKCRYEELSGKHLAFDSDLKRTDPILVRVVEELDERANGSHADLRIRELPEGTLYLIHEYDGSECVLTQDEFKWQVA